ncbi:MAG: GNAT family N-acetyltransferase, partial [Actinobacteria bacterium]|nr:GNAT family N-acetyltransferase [Actinomycetota bacterium]
MSWRSDVAPTLNEGDVRLRPLKVSDARAWQEVRRRNQAWLGPWDATVPDEGVRAGEVPPSFHAMTRRLRAEAREGRVLPWATEFRGRLVGQITMGG